ncbi:MAG: hypothetical protein FRX49_10321 [Trebouxia sp. A1-2]|nr:MAG: hypothetical protein FRX49_10321 [Trebouxia sp. A1-2]
MSLLRQPLTDISYAVRTSYNSTDEERLERQSSAVAVDWGRGLDLLKILYTSAPSVEQRGDVRVVGSSKPSAELQKQQTDLHLAVPGEQQRD